MAWFQFVDVDDRRTCVTAALYFHVDRTNGLGDEVRPVVEVLPLVTQSRSSTRGEEPDPLADVISVRSAAHVVALFTSVRSPAEILPNKLESLTKSLLMVEDKFDGAVEVVTLRGAIHEVGRDLSFATKRHEKGCETGGFLDRCAVGEGDCR